ncbi:MAG TPA: aminotransferase class III-fold pyridoxal phosphate-dependent enzyme [Tepidisphaeraceae bacterium]|jgi:glutamate-1-semialdehyde 2,1-aminomutase|nr:aminotransferase class III-fold pyridoxal phosphate-dependent enzyme [Tepidisphaeraceae bacterium]
MSIESVAPRSMSSWTQRLQDVMPFGSSTSSKAPSLEPEEPAVIVRGKGCRVWDDRGREFIDFRNGLGPVTLGYGFPATDEAIRKQLDSGLVYGHPHPLECEVAEMLRDVIPCAEQVRFLKTGGEALAACIKIARAYTNREHVIQVGYNGWINSLSAGARILPGQSAASNVAPPGVPTCLSALHHTCAWNDLAAMEQLFQQHDKEIAAVVVAADYKQMSAGSTYYPAIRALTQKHGAVLIYDEIVTGFRISRAGAQEYFKVTPDMAVYAKGMANGMPLSAYVGKRDLMQTAKRAVISTTYGGEALSLAAARATLQTYDCENVVAYLWSAAEKLWSRVNQLMKDRNIGAKLEGFWPCAIWSFGHLDSSKFFRACYKHGLSLYNVSYVNFSHRDADIDDAVKRFEKVCDELSA